MACAASRACGLRAAGAAGVSGNGAAKFSSLAGLDPTAPLPQWGDPSATAATAKTTPAPPNPAGLADTPTPHSGFCASVASGDGVHMTQQQQQQQQQQQRQQSVAVGARCSRASHAAHHLPPHRAALHPWAASLQLGQPSARQAASRHAVTLAARSCSSSTPSPAPRTSQPQPQSAGQDPSKASGGGAHSGGGGSSGSGAAACSSVLHKAPNALVAVAAVSGGLGRAGGQLLARAAALGAQLNQVTGYDVIEKLKAKVDGADDGLAVARAALRSSKAAYEARVAEYSETQRQLMGLLQRKGSWGSADVEQFAELCRDEHALEGGVAAAKAAYGGAIEGLEAAHASLLSAIRERYAAETLWSDKIRRASTWWTAGLIGLNLVSFLSVYLILEPIKARRLRTHVEEVLHAELGAVRHAMAALAP